MKDFDFIKRIEPTAVLVVSVGGRIFYAGLQKNPSAKAFTEKLSPERLTLDMHDNGGYEKTASLPWDLPQGESCEVKPGDVVLYGNDRIAICLKENKAGAVKLASVDYKTEELAGALGDGAVTVGFRLEWSE